MARLQRRPIHTLVGRVGQSGLSRAEVDRRNSVFGEERHIGPPQLGSHIGPAPVDEPLQQRVVEAWSGCGATWKMALGGKNTDIC